MEDLHISDHPRLKHSSLNDKHLGLGSDFVFMLMHIYSISQLTLASVGTSLQLQVDADIS